MTNTLDLKKRIRNLRSIAVRNISFNSEYIPHSSSYGIQDDNNLQPETSMETCTHTETVEVNLESHNLDEDCFQLLNTFLTLHENENDPPFYMSEVCPDSLNPSFGPLDSSNLPSWIWNEDEGSLKLLIQWTVDLRCLHFISSKLYDYPIPLRPNTILFEFSDGFYTSREMSREEKLNGSHPMSLSISLDKEKKSYDGEAIMRLVSLQNTLLDHKKSLVSVARDADNLLSKKDMKLTLKRQSSKAKAKLQCTQEQIKNKQIQLESCRRFVDSFRDKNKQRQMDFEEANLRCSTGKLYLTESRKNLTQNKALLENTKQLTIQRKCEMIYELQNIYPIEPSPIDPSMYQILGVTLPNSVFTGNDEEMIATALGYTAHVVTLMAGYMDVPLRYPIKSKSSRATIFDPVSRLQGSYEFPLYSKGEDRSRFEYGVFLLNKNIEQLLYAERLTVLDLRNTLPNLKWLIQTYLYRHHIGMEIPYEN
ncbi:hypothetical protein K7432_005919 [Basidiobolus ranarum]|uniref:Autophagy-related protein 14 n=1 Tax=Basidiobolus ranarum TaxID=34480 RepID=A0ABR2W2F8_9FUNG